MIPQPPLALTCTPIRSEDDPTVGYVVIRIPPSPSAPHMVNGRYPVRSDTSTYALSDAEVTALHARRRALELDGLALLAAEFDRDPVIDSGVEARQAHLFLLAQPNPGMPDMALHIIDGLGWHRRLRELIERGAYGDAVRSALSGVEDHYPGLHGATESARRPNGAALANLQLDAGRGSAATS